MHYFALILSTLLLIMPQCLFAQEDSRINELVPCIKLANSEPDSLVTALEQRFNKEAAFEIIINELESCDYRSKDTLNLNIPARSERLKALSLYYLAAERSEPPLAFEASIDSLISINEDYSPLDNDPPFFKEAIIKSKQELRRKRLEEEQRRIAEAERIKLRKTRRFWISAAAFSAITATTIVLLSDEDPRAPTLDPLPPPPGDPQ